MEKLYDLDLYIFDCDYTLFDTSLALEKCYEKAFKNLGFEYDVKNVKDYIKEGLAATFSRFESLNNKERFFQFEQVFLKASAEYNLKYTKIYQDTFQTLSLLFKAHKHIGIVTGKPKVRVMELLRKFGLSDYVEYIIGYGDYKNEKPDPEALNRCINFFTVNFNISLDKMCYIGDSKNDVIASKNAGIYSVLIDRNEDYEGTKPNIKIKSLSQLIRIYDVIRHTLIKSDFDIFKDKEAQNNLYRLIKDHKYEYIEKENKEIDIYFTDFKRVALKPNGVLVFTELISDYTLDNPTKILAWKQKETYRILNTGDNEQHDILNIYNSLFTHLRKYETRLKKCKVSYTLICYLTNLFINELKDDPFIEQEIFHLMSKKENCINELTGNNLQELLIDSKALYSSISSDILFAAIWGARMMIFSKYHDARFIHNEDEEQYLNSYIDCETNNQHAWLLLSNSAKEIDELFNSVHTRKEEDYLMKKMYDILYSQAQFNHISAITTHRYKMNIAKILYDASELDELLSFFKEKSDLLERKISFDVEKKETENSSILNIILFFLTIISTISEIFNITSALQVGGVKGNLASIIVSAVVGVLAIILLIINKLFNKHK